VLLVAGLSLPIRPAKRAASLSLAGGGGARASSPSRDRFGLTASGIQLTERRSWL